MMSSCASVMRPSTSRCSSRGVARSREAWSRVCARAGRCGNREPDRGKAPAISVRPHPVLVLTQAHLDHMGSAQQFTDYWAQASETRLDSRTWIPQRACLASMVACSARI